MKIMTLGDMNELVRKAYLRGFEDGRNPKDRIPEPEVPDVDTLEFWWIEKKVEEESNAEKE